MFASGFFYGSGAKLFKVHPGIQLFAIRCCSRSWARKQDQHQPGFLFCFSLRCLFKSWAKKPHRNLGCNVGITDLFGIQWFSGRTVQICVQVDTPGVIIQELSSDDDGGQESGWRPGQAASSGDPRAIALPDGPLHEEQQEGVPAPETPSEAHLPLHLAKRRRWSKGPA